MSHLKRVQHRVQKDTSIKENSDLKRQIKELKRKIKRLEKQLEQGLPALEEQILAEKLEMAEEELVSTANGQCPNCDKYSLFVYTSPAGKKIQGCKSCRKHRKIL